MIYGNGALVARTACMFSCPQAIEEQMMQKIFKAKFSNSIFLKQPFSNNYCILTQLYAIVPNVNFILKSLFIYVLFY